ncbi:uncharacterized protein I303_106654 [Kwoniella dejecticola CBS 10117]|uniref:Swi5-dependent recombination DNA repair protein 1 n=1 Tax=Kwoniella dejecticola CBS 10117 TaxID=1296121 RepID=A0A1A5ZU30_9TREE|nr:uncharacterized protein I303_08703 [Kwoniella dejecticola CBS 10117]OBR81317.1 hypothetical protein I303_08703 [Kwoniella dejecticola CBS 10117]
MSRDSQALILWQPRYLFFPPVQEPPPPTQVFRHVDLGQRDGRSIRRQRSIFGPATPNEAHTPDHESIFPQIYLNNTFLRFILNPPRHLHTIQLAPHPSFSGYTNTITHPDRSSRTEAFIEDVQEDADVSMEDSDEEEEEEKIEERQVDEADAKESSLESIDEGCTISPAPTPDKPTARPTKIVLKRKSPEPARLEEDRERPEEGVDEDVFQSTDIRAKRSKSNEKMEQWRVGKRPGYQGSFIAPKKIVQSEDNHGGGTEGGSIIGRKRTFNEDITSSAEKVLKKPFKPPTRVILRPKLNTKPSPTIETLPPSSSPPSTLIKESPSSSPIVLPKVDPFFPDFPTPPYPYLQEPAKDEPKSKTKSKISAKPFKTPAKLTAPTSFPTPTPTPKANSRSRSTNSHDIYPTPMSLRSKKSTDTRSANSHSEMTALQNEIMITKQALKYLREDDDEKLRDLVVIWRNAGREIVEKLFGVVPKPIDFGDNAPTKIFARYNRPSFFAEDELLGVPSGSLSNDQLEYIKNAPRNRDGEVCDEDGISLMLGVSQREQDRFWEEVTSGKQGDSNQKRWSSQTPLNYTVHKRTTSSTPTEKLSWQSRSLSEPESESEAESQLQEWNYAALMRMYGVDPALLGWNEVVEDWEEMIVM